MLPNGGRTGKEVEAVASSESTVSWWRAVAVWLALMAAESVHGFLRVLFLEPLVGEFRARQIAVFTGALILVCITTLCIPWLRARSMQSLLLIGCLWVVLTVVFEMVLGRVVFHLSWQRIAAEYNLARGGLMPIGLVILAFAPVIAARMRARRG